MKGDRPEAERGYNDDLIFALGLALYIRDTEYGNVAITNNMYKSMLDAISIGNSSSTGKIDDGTPKKEISDVPSGSGGLFIQNNTSTDEPEDDLSWLMG
jgi:hypothetical protein